jgi:tol-pal system protein YbgF
MAALAGLVMLLGLVACAGPGQQAKAQMESAEATGGQDLDALKGAMEASYDRERALSERLRQLEESQSQLRADLDLLETQLTGTPGGSGAAPGRAPVRGGTAPAGAAGEVGQVYPQAQAEYNARQYERALRQFATVIELDPAGDLADNAQFWVGECYWGLGKYTEAMAAFAKVFAYTGSDKADDAQLKIGRCYAALGEKIRAEEAFQKLLDEYPESEYVDAARKELARLSRP